MRTTRKILITGGLGHIGSALSHYLSSWAMNEVVVIDDMSAERYCSILQSRGTWTFKEGRFQDLDEEFLSEFDTIIHLAAVTNAAKSVSNPELVEQINRDDTLRFIDRIAAASGAAHFIFPSSTSVYGSGHQTMYESNPDCLNPQSPYASAKIDVESFLAEEDRVPYTILRLGTIFGYSTGMRFHTAVNKFCWQAATGQPLTVWRENYEHYRPYLSVKDAVRAIEEVIEQQEKTNGEVYNVITCNEKLSRVIDLIKTVADIDINWIDTPLLNQHTYYVNDNKIRALGFEPKGDLPRSIHKVMMKLDTGF